MKFVDLLRIVGDEPVFETSLLFAGRPDVAYIQRQLSRWTRAGALVQLRRELYALAPPFLKTQPHPFLVANRMVRASYVSTESALQHHGLIPEYVPVTTSVTTVAPGRWNNASGSYQFQHIKASLFFGFAQVALGGKQVGFVATPEKALLDLIHLRAGADSMEYIAALRLQHLDRLSLDRLDAYASRSDSPKLARAAGLVRALAETDAGEYEVLR